MYTQAAGSISKSLSYCRGRCNMTSIVKPTRCTNFSNLFCFRM